MEKEILKVAMLQMSCITGNFEANIKKVKAMTSSLLTNDLDVLVLPEVWTVGWSCKDFIQSAQTIQESSACRLLSNIASTYKTYVIGGSIILKGTNGKYYNTCPVFDRSGNLIATYSKMHLYSYYGCDEGNYVTEGDFPVMIELDGVKIGLSICYDIRFPELYRAYAKEGVDILVNCAAWGAKKPIPWEMMTKSRAIENQAYMIALTQCGKINDEEYNLGQSRIIDYKGDEISSIMEGEGIVFAQLNIKEMKEFRKKAPTICDIKDNYEVKTLCIK